MILLVYYFFLRFLCFSMKLRCIKILSRHIFSCFPSWTIHISILQLVRLSHDSPSPTIKLLGMFTLMSRILLLGWGLIPLTHVLILLLTLPSILVLPLHNLGSALSPSCTLCLLILKHTLQVSLTLTTNLVSLGSSLTRCALAGL